MKDLKVFLVFYLKSSGRYDYTSGIIEMLGRELRIDDSEPYYFAAFTREIDAVKYCQGENKGR